MTMIVLKRIKQLYAILFLTVLLLAMHVPSFAENEDKKAFAVERMLVAAGFSFKVADDDAMLAKMAKLPQHQLIRHERKGQTIWIYPNVDGCKCLYAGNEAAYEQFKKLAKENKRDIRRFGGTGEDSISSRESAPMEVLDIDDGMLPGM
jgi:hypothetical protein